MPKILAHFQTMIQVQDLNMQNAGSTNVVEKPLQIRFKEHADIYVKSQ